MTFSPLTIRDGCGRDSGSDVKNAHHMLRALCTEIQAHRKGADGIPGTERSHLSSSFSLSLMLI